MPPFLDIYRCDFSSKSSSFETSMKLDLAFCEGICTLTVSSYGVSFFFLRLSYLALKSENFLSLVSLV